MITMYLLVKIMPRRYDFRIQGEKRIEKFYANLYYNELGEPCL